MVISYGADLRDGSMYGQALATIALCEAYGMTHDPALKEVGPEAINFIVYAQDAKGGGWRYTPGAPGDTTVTGWMLMALKSGQMAGLEVPSPSIFLAERFLASVQNEDGSQYGYMTPQAGADHDGRRPAVPHVYRLAARQSGAASGRPASDANGARRTTTSTTTTTPRRSCSTGPGRTGTPGTARCATSWSATQAKVGHESGSWYFSGRYGEKGGRLYNTAMAIMILEVYYRYMPLFSDKVLGGF